MVRSCVADLYSKLTFSSSRGAALVRAGLGSVMEAYGDPVPGVHERDGVGDVGNLLVVIVTGQWLIRRVWGVRHLDVGESLGPFKRGFLRLSEVRALSPSCEAIKAFIGLAGQPQVACV